MANYKGHIIGGVIAGAVVAAGSYIYEAGSLPDTAILLADWQVLIGLLIVSVLFALWPDVDTNSKAQDLFIGIAFATDLLLIANGYYGAAALLGLLVMTPILGHHRGWTHSKIAMVLIPAPIALFPYFSSIDIGNSGLLFYAAAVAGYFSHLLLDGLIWKRFRIKGSW